MPVHCDLSIEPLSAEAFGRLDYCVMGYAFKCHKKLGRLADERVYEACLVNELRQGLIESHHQVPVTLSHGVFRKTYYLDLVVTKQGIYELKAVERLTMEHKSQLLTYLYLLNQSRGKLVNFRTSKVESQFVNAPLTREFRTSFSIDSSRYCGDRRLFDETVELLRDFGTALSHSLYQEALVQLLGGEFVAMRMVPIQVGDECIENQRFTLSSTEESFRVTCFHEKPRDYEQQLQVLLKSSPLRSIHWININTGLVTFQTITKH